MKDGCLLKLYKISSFKLLLFSSLLSSSIAWSAACCGGGVSAPGLIVGDDEAQVSSSFSQSRTEIDVFADGVWQRRAGRDETTTFKFEGAQIFPPPYDRFQVGFSLPIVKRMQDEVSNSGIGDISLMSGYEFLPDWDYHPWRPKGLVFLSLQMPTGKSVYDEEGNSKAGAWGRGFWSIGLGTVLLKSWTRWDLSMQFEAHQSLERRVNNSLFRGQVKPGPGGSGGGGLGYNIGKARLGASLTWSYDQPIPTTGEGEFASMSSSGAPQKLANFVLSYAYLLENSGTISFSYSDQTLFGTPSNSTLSRAVSISFQKRWLR